MRPSRKAADDTVARSPKDAQRFSRSRQSWRQSRVQPVGNQPSHRAACRRFSALTSVGLVAPIKNPWASLNGALKVSVVTKPETEAKIRMPVSIDPPTNTLRELRNRGPALPSTRLHTPSITGASTIAITIARRTATNAATKEKAAALNRSPRLGKRPSPFTKSEAVHIGPAAARLDKPKNLMRLSVRVPEESRPAPCSCSNCSGRRSGSTRVRRRRTRRWQQRARWWRSQSNEGPISVCRE